MPNAVLWEWAKDNGYTVEYLSKTLGYSWRYTERVLHGWETLSDGFLGRMLKHFPDDTVKMLPSLRAEDE